MKNVFVLIAVLVFLFCAGSARAKDEKIQDDYSLFFDLVLAEDFIQGVDAQLLEFASYPKKSLGAVFVQNGGSVRVQEVLRGSPAHLAGLRSGDRVLKLAGADFTMDLPDRVRESVVKALLEDALHEISIVSGPVRIITAPELKEWASTTYYIQKAMVGSNVRVCVERNMDNWYSRLNALLKESPVFAKCAQSFDRSSNKWSGGYCDDKEVKDKLGKQVRDFYHRAVALRDEINQCYLDEFADTH